MKRWIRFAVGFYPPEWRRRYGREFEALLEDVNPGVRVFFDVLKGALTMQVRRYVAIPLVFAFVGAMACGFMVMRTPAIYASTSTILFRGLDVSSPESFLPKLNHPLSGVLGHSREERAATLIIVGTPKGKTDVSYIRLTYLNRDPVQAQRIAARLAAAVTDKGSVSWSGVIIDRPEVPILPYNHRYTVSIVSGALGGLFIGVLAVAVWRRYRGPIRAH